MKQGYRHFIVIVVAAALAVGSGWLVDFCAGKGFEKFSWFLLAPVSASTVAATLPNVLGLGDTVVRAFMGLVVFLGWYCPVSLAAWKWCVMTKKKTVFCIAVCVLIWLGPMVGYIVSRFS